MPGDPSARRLFPWSLNRHLPAIRLQSILLNPGFYKCLNETSATMRKTWLPWLILSPSLLFLLLFTWFPRAIGL
jgi:sn-glycerol 3-phosphate transport system permease protein